MWPLTPEYISLRYLLVKSRVFITLEGDNTQLN